MQVDSPHSLVPSGKQPFSVTNLWARFTQGRWKKVLRSREAREKGENRYQCVRHSNTNCHLPKPPNPNLQCVPFKHQLPLA